VKRTFSFIFPPFEIPFSLQAFYSKRSLSVGSQAQLRSWDFTHNKGLQGWPPKYGAPNPLNLALPTSFLKRFYIILYYIILYLFLFLFFIFFSLVIPGGYPWKTNTHTHTNKQTTSEPAFQDTK